MKSDQLEKERGKERTDAKKKRAVAILTVLHAAYPDATCTLNDVTDPFRLLVAAILAAQCTDARVNLVTPALFERFPTVQAFAAAEAEAIEPYIKSCGLYHNKARNICLAARYLLDKHGGILPDNEKDLLAIPGVGRKIANLLLGDAFGKQAIVVDTHCARISRLLGFTRSRNPLVVERDLQPLIPEAEQAAWGHLMVAHGRAVCRARRPNCAHCSLLPLCDYGSGAEARGESAVLETGL